MQHSEHTETTSSGTSNVPSALPYPRTLPLDQIPEIHGQLVYVIRAYPENGLSVVIYRDLKEGDVYLSLSDWDGNPIDLRNENHPYYEAAVDFAQHDSSKIVAMMKTLGIDKLVLYISVDGDELRLVDLRASLDKFYGPGMIRDLFSKSYPTQEVVKVVALDENVLEAVKRGEGSFKGNLILKCSKFKTVIRGKELLPLYAKVDR
jgi:hypothetical protein